MKLISWILLSGAFLLAGLLLGPGALFWTLAGAVLATLTAAAVFVEDTARMP